MLFNDHFILCVCFTPLGCNVVFTCAWLKDAAFIFSLVNWQWEYASEDGEDYEWEYSEEEGEEASKEKEKQKKVEEEEDEELEDLDLPDPFGTDPVPQKKDVRPTCAQFIINTWTRGRSQGGVFVQ